MLEAFQGLIIQILNCAIKFNGVAHMLEIKQLLQYHAEQNPNSSLSPTVIETPFFTLIFPSLSHKHTYKTQSVIAICTYNYIQPVSSEPQVYNK